MSKNLFLNIPSSYHKGLGLIYAPIQDLLAEEKLAVIEVLKRFALPKVRYDAAQTSKPLESQDGQLSCNFTFLDDCDGATVMVLMVDGDGRW